MSAIPSDSRYTEEEYLLLERAAEFKSEYIDGRIVAMTGASRAHNLISGNVFAQLHQQLRGRPCESYTADMRVKAPVAGFRRGRKRALYTYPDVVAVCGEPRFEDDELDTLLNPAVVVEVLSPSTETYDRGEKFSRYRHIPSLRDYVIIAQDEVYVEHFTRDGEEWILREIYRPGEAVELASIGCMLPLDEIYDKVEFRPIADGFSP